MKNTDRRLELSAKFMEMGQALTKEGEETQDYTVLQTGNFMVILASTIFSEEDTYMFVFSEEDTYMFGEVCSMFQSKKILDTLSAGDNPVSQYIKEKNENESYDDLIKRINKMRGNNDPLKE